MRELLERLEASRSGAAELRLALAYLAAPAVEHEPGELNGALRRAELLLAAGGDPRRELEPDGRAVTAVASDLDAPPARAALQRALEQLLADAEGLPAVREALGSLLGDGELAWRSYASAILADELSGEG